MDRLKERNDLKFLLAQLVVPLTRLGDTSDQNEHMRIVGRFMHDVQQFSRRVSEYAHSERGHDYRLLVNRIGNSLATLTNRCDAIPIRVESITETARSEYDKIFTILEAFPVVPQSQIFDAETPFACYNFIRNLSMSATHQVVIFDRYIDASVFHRYLADIGNNVAAVIITLPQAEMRGNRDVARYREFLDISRLYAAEHGADKYRLATLPGADFHDRWLRVDNQLYALGGSLKDLDQRFTISKIDSTAENIGKIDAAVSVATEIFGPAIRVHP
jgi:hypothetical protein